MNVDELKKTLQIPEELFENVLAQKGWSWHQLARGELGVSFEDLQLGIICADPVLWGKAFLKLLDDETPLVLWDYQQKSAMFWGNVLHEDGAEVGKTQEIVLLHLWDAFIQGRGKAMVTGPMQTHLDSIIDEMRAQLAANPTLERCLVRHKKNPHHQFDFADGYKIYFRPAGYEGTAFRGMHINRIISMDEAAKAKNPAIWKEFWRSGMPGCIFRIYSTPDGDRTTIFYKLCASSDSQGGEGDKDSISNLEFRKFNWPKTLMPKPFWTQERKQFFVRQYGGEDSPGYLQNVLGKWGPPENAVFPYHRFIKCWRTIPEYTCVKVLYNETAGEVSLFVAKYELIEKDGGRDAREDIVNDQCFNLKSFSIEDTLRQHFRSIGGVKFMGADLGYTQDPTEILIRLVYGKTRKIIARLQLRGCTYDQQALAFDTMRDIFEPEREGLDKGNAGGAVMHILLHMDPYKDKGYEDTLVGVAFGEACDAMDEDGNILIDPKTDEPIRLLRKELSTDLLDKRLQRCHSEYPADPDFMTDYTSHTYRVGPRHRHFRDTDDHTIDSERTIEFAELAGKEIKCAVFSSGVHFR